MNDIDKMVVEEGVIKIKEAEVIIPAKEIIVDTQALISRKEALQAHIVELQDGVSDQEKALQQSIDNDTAQINSMQAEVDKINALLGGVAK